jgi:hypothetical protein
MPSDASYPAHELDEAEWQWLEPHLARDAVIFVHPSLNLVEVAIAIANDQSQQVQAWISHQWLYKPSPELVATLDQAPERRFMSLIVQPYVLLQDLPDPPPDSDTP